MDQLSAAAMVSTQPSAAAAGSDTGYLEWRAKATVPPPSSSEPLEQSESMANMVAMATKVEEYLSLEDSPHQKTALTTDSWDIVRLLEADADWTSLATMQRDKISAINALGGPRVMCVWSGTCAQLQRLPRYPDDVAHILDAELLLDEAMRQMDDKGKVACTNIKNKREQRIPCLSMFSHRWERPDLDPSRAFPDSPSNKKAAALGYYGEAGVCPEFAKHQWDYYYWIDYACIDQEDYDQKLLGIAKLPGYISCAIELIYYHSATADYEARAWTRLERVLAFAYTWSPAFVHMDDDYPDRPLRGERMRALIAKHPEVFHIDAQPDADGGEEDATDSHTMSMTITDPLGPETTITDPRDREYIARMCALVARTRILNPACKGGGQLELGKSRMPVDTLHSELDCEKRIEESVRLDSR
jgi:hypothetical protein